MLEPLEVIIPYQNLIAESLDLSKPRVQRDHLKLIGNVYTLAYLHQKQRDKLIIGDKEYIIANYQDLMNAIKYTFPFINDSYMGLDASTRKVYDIIKELSSKWTENSKGIHTNDIVKASNEKFGKGRKWADKRLEKLLNQSMITRDYLRNDVDIPGYYYNIIFNYRKSLIDVELTEESLKAETLKWEDDIKKRLPDSEIKKYFPSV